MPLLMAGFRIICCSKLEPQTLSEFPLLVVMTEASLNGQAGLEAMAHCSFPRSSPVPGRVGRDWVLLPSRKELDSRGKVHTSSELMFPWGPCTRQILSCQAQVLRQRRERNSHASHLGKKATNQRKRLFFWKPSANVTVVFQECLEH